VAVGTKRVATAGEEGIAEWVAANVAAKPIGRRLYEVTIKATLGIRDWRRTLRHFVPREGKV